MNWGEFVRRKRLSAGYGLREFADLVGLHPSNYNHMEKGRMAPPQEKARLDQIAEVLGIRAGSNDYATLMNLAVGKRGKLPADVAEFARKNALVPALLRTLANRRLSRQEFQNLIQRLNEDLARPRRG
jgi:transcriptional regulator with XRE-family HTH domain